jgi:hypothetical protein
VAVSPAAAAGLVACSPDQIGLHNAAEPRCPDASKVGSVEVHTPLLPDPLRGWVYIAQQSNNPFNSLLAIYVVAQGDGVLVKLAGHILADPGTGQLTTTFDDNPQLPFTDFKLDFFGGPRAALSTPESCGAFTTTSSLTPWSGTAPVPPSDSFTIGTGCTKGFSPSFEAGSVNAQAGAFSPFTLTLSRSDADQKLEEIAVRMPQGVLGMLKSVPRCPEPQASNGTCGAESEIGHTTVAAGVGSTPLSLAGKVFLTGPYNGAPFGLSIVVPAVAGPFNLGNVVVRAAVQIDPHTAQVLVTSDPLPRMIDSVEGMRSGIPADVRTVTVTIDRSGFMLNPTSCNPTSVSGTITSTHRTSVAVTSRFQVGGCASLVFAPKFTAVTQSRASKADGASLDVKVASGPGQANIAKVRVLLPRALPSRLSTLQQACLASVFDRNPAGCPAGSVVGTATARTPVLKDPLTGPVYLVSNGGARFPDLVLVLQGEGITLYLDGNTNIRKGITSSTFEAVPDAPISTFDLMLPEGPHSALAATANLCRTNLTMPTTITGQNGAVVKQATRIAVSGCVAHRPRKAKSTRRASSRARSRKT